jgi:hypothetical protein
VTDLADLQGQAIEKQKCGDGHFESGYPHMFGYPQLFSPLSGNPHPHLYTPAGINSATSQYVTISRQF